MAAKVFREEKLMMTLYVFANSIWNTRKKMNGGDKRILEILKQWDADPSLPFKCVVYAPQKFINFMEEAGIRHISYVVTSTKTSESKSVIPAYLLHTFKALRLIPYFQKDCCFYSTSEFFPDTIPCLFGKIFNRHSRWITIIHHLIESYKTRPGNKTTNFISYSTQRMSLFLIRICCDKILLVSPLVKDFLESKGASPKKLVLVDNGVDSAYIKNMSAYEEPSRRYDAVMLARLDPSKGIFDLPEIWSAVCAQRPDARLGLIGGGGTEDIIAELKRLIAEKGIASNMDVLGYQDNEAVYRYLKSAGIFLFTSREEGWGISIAEAMACGLPVIAFELPVYKYVFSKGILLIPDRDKQEMARQAVALLQNSELREKLGNEGREFVLTKYSWEIIAQREKKLMPFHKTAES